jgi:hypothetical protein
MPLKLNVGLSKKIGLPDYGSLGATCHVEIELPAGLLDDGLDQFHERVRRAYSACRQTHQAQAVALIRAYLEKIPATEPKPLAVEGSIDAPLIDPFTGENLGIPLVGVAAAAGAAQAASRFDVGVRWRTGLSSLWRRRRARLGPTPSPTLSIRSSLEHVSWRASPSAISALFFVGSSDLRTALDRPGARQLHRQRML